MPLRPLIMTVAAVLAIKMRESFLGSKRSKQRIGSSSSTDEEIIPAVDASKSLKWLDTLIMEIGLPLSICCHYPDNLSASKIIIKTVKTKQVKHLLSKINLSQQYWVPAKIRFRPV